MPMDFLRGLTAEGGLLTVAALTGLGIRAAQILLVILLGRLVLLVAGRLVDGLLAGDRRTMRYLEERRARTLAALVRSVLRYLVDFLVALTVLSMLGIDTSSILVGAGLVGLAVGFGAQNLVRDFLSGFFILLEDQYGVGELVRAGGHEGVVEEIGLRTTRLRSFGGEIHTIPNGKIEDVTNMSRGDMRVMFEVVIAYEADLDQATTVIDEALGKYAAENPAVVEGPRVLGVQDLGESGVSLLIWGRTKPMQQWSVGRDLRRRVKQALDGAGIEIPYPRRVMVPPEATSIGRKE
ncbi:MAG: mechanosensitive ion channel family protein [bacterium]|nr:mechanosensitive ion channel family protein [bacterium]